jgi:alanine racemase
VRRLLKNLHTLRAIGKREVIPVIKADAYGHGMVAVGKALAHRGSCHMIAVATLEEAMELRKALPRGVAILVLSGFLPHQADAYVRYRLTPMIHSLNHLKTLIGRRTMPDIHLKLDSGMHRLGLLPTQLKEAMKVLEKMNVKLAGVATHFAESEKITSEFNHEQIECFEKMLGELRERRLVHTDARIHIGNSGAVLNDKLNVSNAIRPGLALYGISPNERLPHSEVLFPVLEWKTRILCLKDLPRGATVGYGRTYKVPKKEKIAMLPIGYADGYPRLLSTVGEVLIAGRRCPVRGRVSMDLTAVDVSHVPHVKEGASVILFGTEGKHSLSNNELANGAQTIPYEILCGISPRVPRVYLD